MGTGKRSHTGLLVAVVLFVGIFTIGLSIGSFILTQQHDDAIQAAREAEYRICQRQMVNRASINLDENFDERTLPIYDCTPNLKGYPAKRLTPTQARAFEHWVKTAPESQLP